MTGDELHSRAKVFIEDKPACSEALAELKKGKEIRLILGGSTECACYYDGSKAVLERRAAKQPDVEFSANSEAIRRLAEIPGDNLADAGIEIVREVIAGNISIQVLSSPMGIIRGGYLGIVKKAGPDFFSYLAQHGLSNIFKVISYIKRMKSQR